MFWIGVAVGIIATIGILLAEHLIGQISRDQRACLARKLFSKNAVSWISNPWGAVRSK
jgi:hypothetical protein